MNTFVRLEREEIARLFGKVSSKWNYEKIDLAAFAFHGGPQRAFFEGMSADACFLWLQEAVPQYPDGWIDTEAMEKKVTDVQKFDGAGNQLFLAWMWQ